MICVTEDFTEAFPIHRCFDTVLENATASSHPFVALARPSTQILTPYKSLKHYFVRIRRAILLDILLNHCLFLDNPCLLS